MRRGRAVVTGIGVIAGPVCGIDALAEALRDSNMPAAEVDRSAGYHLECSARFAILSGGVDFCRWLKPAEMRRMSYPSKLAVAAARMAIEDAGLDVRGDRTTVALSNAYSAVQCTEQLLRSVIAEGPEAASPFLFAESVANAPAAQVAIATGAQGRNVTITQREAGILTAAGRGAEDIEAGRADMALVGGVEEMPPLLHALLDRFESLARPADGAGEIARPFDRCRNGFVAAEGAVVLVLEEEAHARARGAHVRARVRAFGGAFDPTAPRIGWGSGHRRLASALRRVLNRAGLEPRHIGRVVSGASGAVAGDRLEALTLLGVWEGVPLPPILVPKAVTGQYGGGFLASAVIAAEGGVFGPTPGFREIDPQLGVRPYDGGVLAPASLTLVTSLAAGGSASWLVLENPS